MIGARIKFNGSAADFKAMALRCAADADPAEMARALRRAGWFVSRDDASCRRAFEEIISEREGTSMDLAPFYAAMAEQEDK